MPIQRSKGRATCAALFLLVVLAAPLAGAESDRIASFTAGDPFPLSDSGPEIAIQPGGSFLVIWEQGILPTTSVRAQRFDAGGRPLAPAVRLWNAGATHVAPLPDGGFVAVSELEEGLGNNPSGIGLHRLDAFGRQVGDPIVVALDESVFYTHHGARVAVAPNGTVAVVWQDSAAFSFDLLHGRFFDSSLHPLTEAFLLPAASGAYELDPEISFQADGTALAVWSRNVGTLNYQIFARRFSASGAPLSEDLPFNQPEFLRVNSGPHVVAGRDGGWVLGWHTQLVPPPPIAPLDAGSEGIRILRLNAEGAPLGSEQALDFGESASPFGFGMDAAGDLLVFGMRSNSIVGRLFDPNGTPSSDLLQLSAQPTYSHQPTLDGRTSASFVAAWSGTSTLAIEDSDVFGTILAPPCLDGRSAACLGPDGRYGVEVTWQLGAQSGGAKPLPLAGNVATFGLHNAVDPDVTVLLSGAGSRDLTFAATTGAALEIRVTDKTTGTIRTFKKSAGRFGSGLFPNALPSLAGSSADSAIGGESGEEKEAHSLATLPAVGLTCVPTSRALCLLGGRFRAELLAGRYPNAALAILRTDKSGAFALPRAPETPLATLTMIDGRASNGKFWVYLGGLSPSGYRVRITDLSTGAAKIYTNPIGKLDSRADRSAF